MTEAARDLNMTPATTTEGLDELFADATQCEAVAIRCEEDATQNATQCEYTIIEASQLLKVSPSTIYRRIKAGKYQTTENEHGGLKVMLPRNVSQREAVALQYVAVDSQSDAVATHCEESDNENETLAKAVVQMAQKLEAANYRIGWLESQLQEREKEVRLLTDAQHQPKWWHKIRSWFAGQ